MKMNRRDFLRTSALTGAGIVAGGLSGLPGREAGAAARSGVRLPAEEIPVGAEADVVVIGGGPGGFGAALAAARKGATTVLIDRYDVPGGVHTTGLQGAYNPGVGGIHTELMDRLVKEGYVYTATEKTYPGFAGNPLSHYDKNMKAGGALARSTFNPEGGACVMLAMLNECGRKDPLQHDVRRRHNKKAAQGRKEHRGRGRHERIGRVRSKRQGFHRRLGHSRGGLARRRAVRQRGRTAAFNGHGRER